LDNNGGRLAVLHDNERVMTAEQNKQIGGMSNEELTKLAVDSRRGTFKQFENVSSPTSSILVQQNENIKGDIQELIREVKKNRPVDPVHSFDKRTGVLKEIVRHGNTIKNNHKPLFHPKRPK